MITKQSPRSKEPADTPETSADMPGNEEALISKMRRSKRILSWSSDISIALAAGLAGAAWGFDLPRSSAIIAFGIPCAAALGVFFLSRLYLDAVEETIADLETTAGDLRAASLVSVKLDGLWQYETPAEEQGSAAAGGAASGAA